MFVKLIWKKYDTILCFWYAIFEKSVFQNPFFKLFNSTEFLQNNQFQIAIKSDPK